MSEPKISVVVPVYNVEPYIAECLESIANQTLDDIEIICVDDCGADGSMKIVEMFAEKDRRFRVVRHERNRGLGAGRNSGIVAASGKYISFVDSDDWIEPRKLELEYAAIVGEKYPVVWSGYYSCDVTGTNLQSRGCLLGDSAASAVRGEITVGNEDIGKYLVTAWNKLYSLDFIRSNRLAFPEDVHYEDMPFYFACWCLSPTVYVIDEPLYGYRQRSDSIMGRTSVGQANCGDVRRVLACCYDFLAERDMLESRETALLNFILAGSYQFLFSPRYKLDMIDNLKQLFMHIGFPKSYGEAPRDLMLVARYKHRPLLLRMRELLLAVNKLNPVPSLRRKWRNWIKDACLLK